MIITTSILPFKDTLNQTNEKWNRKLNYNNDKSKNRRRCESCYTNSKNETKGRTFLLRTWRSKEWISCLSPFNQIWKAKEAIETLLKSLQKITDEAIQPICWKKHFFPVKKCNKYYVKVSWKE